MCSVIPWVGWGCCTNLVSRRVSDFFPGLNPQMVRRQQEQQLDGSIGVFDDDWFDRLGVMVWLVIAEPTLIHRENGFLGDVRCNPTHKAYHESQTH